uniref:Uncharacterized protein n=1 Tax=Noccaea caerulescens TaxID=107243 RepID=A0A1J3DMY5_NOCCA
MKLSESRGEAEKHRRQQHFEHELKKMISSLTYMGGAEKAGPSQYGEEENKEDDGIRVITLSGSNIGAIMKTDLDNNNNHGGDNHELDDFRSTFVNSNFQAVNNSIMMGAHYETNDPGVHLDISGDVETPPMKKTSSRESREKKGKTSTKSDRRE